jgi:hypothetical protein
MAVGGSGRDISVDFKILWGRLLCIHNLLSGRKVY